MAEELQYTSKYDGVTTDELLAYAQEAKELLSNEYVRSMKEQVEAEDAETVHQQGRSTVAITRSDRWICCV